MCPKVKNFTPKHGNEVFSENGQNEASSLKLPKAQKYFYIDK
jgi:hypothetical protein